MAEVFVRLRGDGTDFFRVMNAADQRVTSLQSKVVGLDGALNTGFKAAALVGLAVTFDQVGRAIDRTIDRYNVLRGLDQGRLFFNANNDIAAMTRGLGDLAVQAEITAQSIRFLSAEANLTPMQITQVGQYARAQVLLGESPSIYHALHGLETYIVGGQSRAAR